MTDKDRNPFIGTHPDLFPPEERYPIAPEPVPASKMPKLAGALLREAKKHEAPEVTSRAAETEAARAKTRLRAQAKREAAARIREQLKIPPGRRAKDLSSQERAVLEAVERGETPIFADLESLTSEQIRALPRAAFTEDEWDRLDDDDRESIEENDRASEARVDALVKIFVSRYKGTIEYAVESEDYGEYFHDYLRQERDLYNWMPSRRYDALVSFADGRGMGEGDVDEIINDYLGDPGRYNIGTDGRGSVWSWEVEASFYIEGDDISEELEGMTEDEKERAVKLIAKETNHDITPDVDDLEKAVSRKYGSYEENFNTGETIHATIDWDDAVDSIEETIRERTEDYEEEEEDREVDLDAIVIEGKPQKLPRPPQTVVYEWPDGTTIVDMDAADDTIVTITEALGILGIPWKSPNEKKESLKKRMDRSEIRYTGVDDDGMPTFHRGELAFGLESLEMRHCVGWSNMGYMDGVRKGEIKILSMRRANPKERPVFTIEADLTAPAEGKRITGLTQIKSFANSVPGFDRGDQSLVDTEAKIDKLSGRETEEILKKFKRDEVQKIVEWIISIGLDPKTAVSDGDLAPALNIVQLMADREDPWGVELQAKIDAASRAARAPEYTSREWSVRTEHGWRSWTGDSDMHVREQFHATHPGEDIIEVIEGPPTPVSWIVTGWDGRVDGQEIERVAVTEREALEIARSNYPEYSATIRARRANPSGSFCEHGVCEGFCRPYRPQIANPGEVTRMIEPNPQDNPGWVTELLAKHFEFLEENVPARWLPKLTGVSRAKKPEKITAAMREYGCGTYGCVLPTLDPKVVLKITTDDTEYQFARDMAHKLSVQVTVEYYLAIDVPDKHKGRNVYMLWRDSAENVGEIDKKSRKRPNTVESAVDNQHKAAQQAYVALMTGMPALELVNGWIDACREMGKIVPELHALSIGMIRNLQKNKVFMGDVHAGNIGRVGKRWLIIDPGNVAILKK